MTRQLTSPSPAGLTAPLAFATGLLLTGCGPVLDQGMASIPGTSRVRNSEDGDAGEVLGTFYRDAVEVTVLRRRRVTEVVLETAQQTRVVGVYTPLDDLFELGFTVVGIPVAMVLVLVHLDGAKFDPMVLWPAEVRTPEEGAKPARPQLVDLAAPFLPGVTGWAMWKRRERALVVKPVGKRRYDLMVPRPGITVHVRCGGAVGTGVTDESGRVAVKVPAQGAPCSVESPSFASAPFVDDVARVTFR